MPITAENQPEKFGYPNYTPKINTAIRQPAILLFQRTKTPTAVFSYLVTSCNDFVFLCY